MLTDKKKAPNARLQYACNVHARLMLQCGGAYSKPRDCEPTTPDTFKSKTPASSS